MSETLLVPIDLEQEAALDLVMPAAVDMAKTQNAKLHFLAVVPDVNAGMFPYVPEGFMDKAKTEAASKLEAIAKDRLPQDIDWDSEARIGPVARTIVKTAGQLHAGLIVMASHDPKAVDLLLGSTADQVVRRAHCSVLVVRDPSRANKPV